MCPPLSCYYLDEALDTEELDIVGRILLGPWARFKTGTDELKQFRVPFVMPTPDTHGQYVRNREQRAKQVAANLRRAGILADQGRRVAWVMPSDMNWDAIFQYAIRRATGQGPFVIQRWFAQEGQLVRGPIRVIDTQILLEGL